MGTDARHAHPWTRPALVTIGVVAGLHVVLVVVLFGLRFATGDVVLAGTSVDGADVSGLDRGGLTTTVADHATRRLGTTIEIVADDDSLIATRDDAGGRANVDAMVDAAWSRGRRGLYTAAAHHVAARIGVRHDVAFDAVLDRQWFTAWSAQAATDLSVPPQPARIALAVDADGRSDPTVTPPTDGSRVDVDELRREVLAVVDDDTDAVVDVTVEPLDEPTDDADLDAALAALDVALSGPVTLTNPSAANDLVLSAEDLTAVLEVGFDERAEAGARLPVTSDGQRLVDHLGAVAFRALASGPVDATLELSDVAAVVGGTPGIEPDPDAAAALIVALAGQATGRMAELPGATRPADVTATAAQRALEVSGFTLDDVALLNPSDGADLTLDAAGLAAVLMTRFVVDDGEVTLEVDSDGDRLLEHLGGQVDAIAGETIEASVEVVAADQDGGDDGGEPVVQRSGGTSALELDADAAAALVATLATSAERTGQLPGEVIAPRFTAALAATVREEISTFTTSLNPGQPRNTNIQRALQIIDGDVLLPGERYSLNEGIGERTTDRGFVGNGYILDGELTSTTGGGVSQVATTFLNAAWFAGLEIIDFKPHSLYFSRYPEGREATLDFPSIDVVIANDSPNAVLIVTDSSDTQATISLWSTTFAEVETFSGPRTNVVPARITPGFTIEFGRTITELDGTSRTETYSHTYRPRNQ